VPTEFTSQALQKITKGTSEKVSLQMTAETLLWDVVDITWHGSHGICLAKEDLLIPCNY